MNATITIGDAGLLLLGLALFVLLCYCISLVKNLIPVAKSMQRILEDTQVVSSAAADGAEQAKKIVSDVSASVSTVSDAIKGNQSGIQALTSFVNAITSLSNLLKK